MKKILVIRLSSIGDIVLTSPIVRALKLQLGMEVHFLTKAGFTSLMDSNPHVDQVIPWATDWSMLVKQLKEQQYDLIIDLHKNLRTRKIKRALGLPSLQFDKLNIEKWLLVNFKINKLPALHIVDRYFNGIHTLAIENDMAGLDFYIADSTRSIEEISKEYLIPKTYITIAIGAAHYTKQIPFEKLCDIIDKSPEKILLLGGRNEAELGEKVKKSCGEKVIQLAGKTSIMESARIIDHAKALIAPDTGMMHIGVGLKQKVICVWGSTIPEFGMYPYYPSQSNNFRNIEVEGLSCRPCSKLGKKSCPKRHFNCMNQHSTDKIWSAYREITSETA